MYEVKGRLVLSQHRSALHCANAWEFTEVLLVKWKFMKNVNRREELYDFTNERENIIECELDEVPSASAIGARLLDR